MRGYYKLISYIIFAFFLSLSFFISEDQEEEKREEECELTEKTLPASSVTTLNNKGLSIFSLSSILPNNYNFSFELKKQYYFITILFFLKSISNLSHNIDSELLHKPPTFLFSSLKTHYVYSFRHIII